MHLTMKRYDSPKAFDKMMQNSKASAPVASLWNSGIITMGLDEVLVPLHQCCKGWIPHPPLDCILACLPLLASVLVPKVEDLGFPLGCWSWITSLDLVVLCMVCLELVQGFPIVLVPLMNQENRLVFPTCGWSLGALWMEVVFHLDLWLAAGGTS